MNFIQIESVDSKSFKNKAIDLLQKFISCAESTTNITKKQKRRKERKLFSFMKKNNG